VRRATLACVVALVALTSLTSCSKKKDGAEPSASKNKDGTPAAPTITFTVDGVEPNGTKPPGADVLEPVKAVLDAYLRRAVIEPLHSGQPPGDITDLFTAEAQTRFGDEATLATLVEDGLPPASTSITAESAVAKLSSVAGPDGAITLVAARLDVKLHAVGPRIDIDIVRDGELVLTSQQGDWRIDSFGLRTTRNTRDKPEEGGS